VFVATVDAVVGSGLFSSIALEAGVYIGEYTGVVAEDGGVGGSAGSDADGTFLFGGVLWFLPFPMLVHTVLMYRAPLTCGGMSVACFCVRFLPYRALAWYVLYAISLHCHPIHPPLLTLSSVAGSGSDGYLMRYPGDGLHVSARTTGSLMRFINHGDGAAENVNVFPSFIDGAFHMCVVTVAPVVEGTQLLLDYGPSYWAARPETDEVRLD
jgi:hypothetical protein